MPRMPDHGWKEAERALLKLGFSRERCIGDHLIFWRQGLNRPVVLPKYDSLPPFIIANVIRTGKIDREEYIAALK